MKVVVRRTGLSPHLVRVWEKRYHVVTPTRTETNRRLYNDAQIARLRLLHEATRAGHSIGHIARLSEDELSSLLSQEQKFSATPVTRAEPGVRRPMDFVGLALEAVRRLDAAELEAVLGRAAAQYGQLGLVQQVIAPLIQQIGDLWQDGALKVAHEHVASAVIRTFLGHFARAYSLPDGAPRLLVTTPPGQCHELGGILAAVTASNHGWRVTYMGPCLPAEEIAGAVIQNRSRAVGLSLVYPEDDPGLEIELIRLRELLPRETAILAGGRAAPAYRNLLEQIGAFVVESLPDLQARLDEIRKAGKNKESVAPMLRDAKATARVGERTESG